MVATRKRGKVRTERSKLTRSRTPTGPAHAMEAAIAILGPFPWKRPDQLEVANWITDLPESVTEDAIRKQVRKIGSRYLRDLEQDATSIRLKDALAAFREIAALADKLADRLIDLSEDERHLLLSARSPTHSLETWHEHIFGRLPSVFMKVDQDQLEDGTGTEWLRLVSEHTEYAMHSLAEHQKIGTRKTGDLGGRANLNRIRKASPHWGLVKMSWQLFEWAPHCQPSGTAQGRLHEFMGHVHEWVTGENVIGTSKFESHLKAFPRPWQHQNRLVKEYMRLKSSLPEDLANTLDAACSGYRPDLREHLPEEVLQQADALRKKMAAAFRITQFGPSRAAKP